MRPDTERRPLVRNDSQEYLAGLLHRLRQLPNETEWVEFKENNHQPHTPVPRPND